MSEQDGPVVRPEELQDAATACAAVLDVPVSGAAEAVRAVSVLPDGRAGPAAAGLAGRWDAALARWVADVVAHGETLTAAAGGYRDVDASAAAGYGEQRP